MRGELIAALALALCGGCFDGPTLDDETCPPAGTTLAYDNFGASFFAGWCQGCHASDAINRHGAPSHVTFDDVTQIRDRAARIFERSARSNVSMPPGLDDPSREERDLLAEWLACGAP
jgi:uncharacterized membrane protein